MRAEVSRASGCDLVRSMNGSFLHRTHGARRRRFQMAAGPTVCSCGSGAPAMRTRCSARSAATVVFEAVLGHGSDDAMGEGRVRSMLGAGAYELAVLADCRAGVEGSAASTASRAADAAICCVGLADITEDGLVDAADAGALLSACGRVPARHPSDLDQYGEVAANDLARLLVDWTGR